MLLPIKVNITNPNDKILKRNLNINTQHNSAVYVIIVQTYTVIQFERVLLKKSPLNIIE